MRTRRNKGDTLFHRRFVWRLILIINIRCWALRECEMVVNIGRYERSSETSSGRVDVFVRGWTSSCSALHQSRQETWPRKSPAWFSDQEPAQGLVPILREKLQFPSGYTRGSKYTPTQRQLAVGYFLSHKRLVASKIKKLGSEKFNFQGAPDPILITKASI